MRAESVNALGLIKDFSALPEMLDALKDARPGVRTIAARSLVALYTEHDIDFITNRRTGWNRFNPFLDTSDHEIIEPYMTVDPEIIRALGEAARGDDDRDVRVSAIRALGVLRGNAAIPHLAEALNADQDVRIEVLRAFIKIGDPAAGPHLTPFFRDSNQKVRTQAMVAAGMLKYRPAVEPLLSVYGLGPENKGTVSKMTGKVRGLFSYLPPRDEAALWALALIGDERAEQIFVENMARQELQPPPVRIRRARAHRRSALLGPDFEDDTDGRRPGREARPALGALPHGHARAPAIHRAQARHGPGRAGARVSA